MHIVIPAKADLPKTSESARNADFGGHFESDEHEFYQCRPFSKAEFFRPLSERTSPRFLEGPEGGDLLNRDAIPRE